MLNSCPKEVPVIEGSIDNAPIAIVPLSDECQLTSPTS